MPKTQKPAKKRGRPTKLTPEVREEVCKYIRGGLTDGDAAVLTGIHRQTFIEWKKRGDDGEAPFADFVDQLREAELDFKNYHLSLIAKHGKRSAPASQWLLERKFANEFGQRQKLEIIDKLTGFLEAFDKI